MNIVRRVARRASTTRAGLPYGTVRRRARSPRAGAGCRSSGRGCARPTVPASRRCRAMSCSPAPRCSDGWQWPRCGPGSHPTLPPHHRSDVKQGGHRYFEQNKPLSSLSSRGVRRERRPCESHTNNPGGQPQCGSVSPDTWTESGRTSILPRTLSSPCRPGGRPVLGLKIAVVARRRRLRLGLRGR
jgi:hypothetical protein